MSSCAVEESGPVSSKKRLISITSEIVAEARCKDNLQHKKLIVLWKMAASRKYVDLFRNSKNLRYINERLDLRVDDRIVGLDDENHCTVELVGCFIIIKDGNSNLIKPIIEEVSIQELIKN